MSFFVLLGLALLVCLTLFFFAPRILGSYLANRKF